MKGFYSCSSHGATGSHGGWANPNCFVSASQLLRQFFLCEHVEDWIARRKTRYHMLLLIWIIEGISKILVRVILERGSEHKRLSFFFLRHLWFRIWLNKWIKGCGGWRARFGCWGNISLNLRCLLVSPWMGGKWDIFMWSRDAFLTVGVIWANEPLTAKLSFMAASMSKHAWKVYKATSSSIDTLGLAAKRHENLAQVAPMDSSFNYSNARRSLRTKSKWDQEKNEWQKSTRSFSNHHCRSSRCMCTIVSPSWWESAETTSSSMLPVSCLGLPSTNTVPQKLANDGKCLHFWPQRRVDPEPWHSA
jgi:hypothetical protein